jgi:hypothetical protein
MRLRHLYESITEMLLTIEERFLTIHIPLKHGFAKMNSKKLQVQLEPLSLLMDVSLKELD